VSSVAVGFKQNDIKTLINLVTSEIDRVGEAREKHGFSNPSYFYHLVDIRNRLLAMSPTSAKPAAKASPKPRGKGEECEIS